MSDVALEGLVIDDTEDGLFCAHCRLFTDTSRGMKREQPLANDELQMRAFWRK